MNLLRLTLAMIVAAAANLATCAEPPDAPVSAVAKAEVVASLARQLGSTYIFPDVAATTATALSARVAQGGYADATTSRAFARELSADLAKFGNDGHFRVRYYPGYIPEAHGDEVPSAQELAKMRQETLDDGFGIARVERRAGNVGYMDLRGFGPAEFVGDAFTAAMSLLAGTDALIIDLRQNGGGDPAAVNYFMSHFFATGDTRHINDIYNRVTNITQQYWTVASVKVRYTNPVYVLTSSYTFSGGEECAYDFQTQKRATLVGAVTGGGANPGELVALGHDFVAFIPNGRAINPVTHSNWEHVGVKPDIEVPAAQAEQVAYVAILRTLAAAASTPAQADELLKVLARVERGEAETPMFGRPAR